MNRTRPLVLIFFRDTLGRFARLPRIARKITRRARRRPISPAPVAVQFALF